MGEDKGKMTSFLASEETRTQLAALCEHFGKNQSEIIRGLISENYRLLEDEEARPAAGSITFDLQYGDRLVSLIDEKIPRLSDEMKALKKTINDMHGRIWDLEQKGEKS